MQNDLIHHKMKEFLIYCVKKGENAGYLHYPSPTVFSILKNKNQIFRVSLKFLSADAFINR